MIPNVLAGGSPPLIGRDAELALIARSRAASAETATAVVIVGEPGIGKTSLLDAALSAAAVDGSFVSRIGCSLSETGVAWSGLASLISTFDPGWIEHLPDVQREAVEVALGERRPGPDQIAPFVAGAIRTLLRRSTQSAATVLAMDDIHWIDAESGAVISAALRSVDSANLTVIATIRPAAASAIDLHRVIDTRSSTIELEALSASDVHEVLRSRGVAVSQPMLQSVLSLGEGNPLHTVLLADHIRAKGWREGQLPRSIAASHRHQLDSLEPEAVLVLQHAAVHTWIDEAMCGRCLPAVDVEAALLAAERLGLIASDGSGAVSFSHPTVPAAILAGIGPTLRRQIHRRIAESLPDEDEFRAVHLGAAVEQPDEGIAGALDRAARAAAGRGAKASAGQRFLRSAQLTPEHLADDRWTRLLSAADAFVAGADLNAAEAPSLEAFETARDPAQVAMAGGVRAQLLAARGDLIDAHQFIVDLLERLHGSSEVRAYLGRARVRIEQVFDVSAALHTSEALHDEMIAADLPTLATEFEVATLNCRYVLGQPVDASSAWRLAKPIADASDYIGAGWMALEMLVWGCDDDELALIELDRFERDAAAAGSAQSLAKLYDFRGNLLVRLGRWNDGERELRRAVDAADLSEIAGLMPRSGLASLLAATGRIAEARATAARCTTASATDETPMLQAVHFSCVGFIELCAGQWEDAVSALAQGWTAADKVGMGDLSAVPFRADLVEALTSCGRLTEARERALDLVELASCSGRAIALVQADRALTLVDAAAGDLAAARTAADRGLAMHRSIDFPFERARLQFALGTALRRAGHRKEAGLALADASATFALLGAQPCLERARDESRRLGAHGVGEELTPTESQIARRVAAGRSNAEVAAEMVVSLRTVESNLTRIYRKLGLRSRSELAARFRPD